MASTPSGASPDAAPEDTQAPETKSELPHPPLDTGDAEETEAGDVSAVLDVDISESEVQLGDLGSKPGMMGGISSQKATELLEFVPKASKFETSLLEPLSLMDANTEHIDQFAEMYNKLQQALRKSHESENRFINKCKTLTKQIRSSSHKLTALSSLHQTDLKKKEKYKSDIKANRQAKVEASGEVADQKNQIKELQGVLKELQQQLEDISNDSIRDQRKAIERLELEVNKYTVIRDKERASLTQIRSKNIELYKQLQDVLATQKKGQEELDALEKKIRETHALSSKENRRKAELERQMKTLQATVAERKQQIATKKELLEKSKKDLANVDVSLSKAEQAVEQQREEYDKLSESARNLNDILVAVQEENEQSSDALKSMTKEVEEATAASKAAKINAENKRKMLDAIRNRVKVIEAETRDADAVKVEWTRKTKQAKEEINNMQLKLNNNAKQMDTCVREREVLSQNHMAKVDAIKGKEIALKIHKSTLKNVKNEYQGFLVSIRNLTRIIENLKIDKSNHEADLAKRQVQKARAVEEVIEREMKIAQFQQQILLNESKLRQQQNLLEAVRSDRNLYRKQLIEQKNEMQEYKRKYSNLNMQIKQLKQEISEKDIGFVTEHFNLEHVKADIAALKEHNDSTTQRTTEMDEIIKNEARQIRKLTAIIADADEEIKVQMKQYNAIVNEQRVLNLQLIQRNDELAKLYEKLKLQNSVLSKGAKHYEAKLEEVKKLQESRDESVKQLDELMNDIGKYDELKATIGHLQRELLQEKLKTKALTDELKKPINIHRWRRLMDTSTDTYGMINRVRSLQKQIIHKYNQVEEKDKQIQEKEKLYVDLRRVLARQPGSEAAEQLRLYAATLREKKSKFKQMKAELKMYQAKVYEYKYELQKLAQDMQLVKLEYFQRRRRELQGQSGRNSRPDTSDEYGRGMADDDNEEDQYMGTYQGTSFPGPSMGDDPYGVNSTENDENTYNGQDEDNQWNQREEGPAPDVGAVLDGDVGPTTEQPSEPVSPTVDGDNDDEDVVH